MARLLKQSTAFTFRIGPFVDSTDGVTAETGLTIAQADIQISKAGGAFAQTSASPTTTHDTDGWYQCPLTTTDTGTLGSLTVQIVVAGALPVWEHFMVVPANVFDSLISGSDVLDVSTTQFNGSAVTQSGGRPEVNTSHIAGSAVSSTSAQIGVNVVQISTDATAADNLEAMLDGTGSVTLTTAIAGNITGNLSGSVGSVTGAVGSVTGAVGSVTGAVGSVTGAVGSVTGNVGGNVTGSVGSVAAGGITASSFGAGAIDAAALATDAGQEIADRLLARSLAGSADGGRDVRSALRFLRNKKAIAAGTLTVYQEDDSTSAWTAAVTTAAGNPIDSLDPA